MGGESSATSFAQAASDAYPIDRELRARAWPLLRFLFDTYWRVSVRGMEHVPRSGGAILVGNHSGGIPVDAAMLGYALENHEDPTSPRRIARILYDRFIDGMPAVADIYRRGGAVPARYAVADALLARGELVVIFPEGVGGIAKLFDQRYQLQPFATSAARLSWKHRVPIIPFAFVGAEEAYPVIGRSEAAGVAVGAPYVPITPFFPLLGPLGVLPLPSKWTLAFGRRIYLRREQRFVRDPDFGAMTERLRRSVGLLIQRELTTRRSVFFG
ncbi:MAG: 1-acyl-sn-glycerol-3-phosphate acyltransferase [Deltaproteobacteria bacterium]|nr:1-acyl-sn-glycerol-3-phosphate acyltransferase [Deltaproteobacteria bacterium]